MSNLYFLEIGKPNKRCLPTLRYHFILCIKLRNHKLHLTNCGHIHRLYTDIVSFYSMNLKFIQSAYNGFCYAVSTFRYINKLHLNTFYFTSYGGKQLRKPGSHCTRFLLNRLLCTLHKYGRQLTNKPLNEANLHAFSF